jgi:hypothetical protein
MRNSGKQWALNWRGRWLYSEGRITGFSILPDIKWPQMWRIRKPDGSLTDMVNLSRAKDAALVLATHELNIKATAQAAGGVTG